MNTTIKELEKKLQWNIARWRLDPVAFVIECCNCEKYGYPNQWQMEQLYKLKWDRKLAIASGHGVGKSRFLAWACIWVLVCLKIEGMTTKIMVTGPSGAGLSDVIWSEISQVIEHLDPYFRNKIIKTADHVMIQGMEKTCFATLRTASKDNPDALQGAHGNPLFIIIDEGSGVRDEIFEVARGAMSGSHTYACMFGNPTKLNGYFFNAFHSNKSIWKTTHIDCEDHLDTDPRDVLYIDGLGDVHCKQVAGMVSPTYIEEFADEFGRESATYKIRVSGQFPISVLEQLIKTNWLMEAAARDPNDVVDKEEYKRIMGVDIAWTGEDDSAIVIRKGPFIEYIETWHGQDPNETAERAVAAYKAWDNSNKSIQAICVDSVGIGGGTYGFIKKALSDDSTVSVHAVGAQDSAPQYGIGRTICHRMRDWLWWKARLYFQYDEPCFLSNNEENDRLRFELKSPRYTQKTGKVVVESKADLKKRKVKSPDIADALCLTFFADSKVAVKGWHKNGMRSTHKRRSNSPQATSWKLA